MKTKIEIVEEIFKTFKTKEEHFTYYKKWYKDEGFLFEKEESVIYKIYNREIQLVEGERVELQGGDGFFLVDWKCYYADLGMVWYVLKKE